MIKLVLSIICFAIYVGLCVFSLSISFWWSWKNSNHQINSFYHHQIGHRTRKPLLRVRSWNNVLYALLCSYACNKLNTWWRHCNDTYCLLVTTETTVILFKWKQAVATIFSQFCQIPLYISAGCQTLRLNRHFNRITCRKSPPCRRFREDWHGPGHCRDCHRHGNEARRVLPSAINMTSHIYVIWIMMSRSSRDYRSVWLATAALTQDK